MGAVPPKVGVAVKVTDAPAHTLVEGVEMLTTGVTFVPLCTTTAVDVVGQEVAVMVTV